MHTTEIIARFHPAPELTADFAAASWRDAQALRIDRDWRGAPAPVELPTAARVVWSEQEILFGFNCGFTELDMDEEFDVSVERYALWDRDVCEAFVRSPRELHAQSYREFEVAPTGQWCDLMIDRSVMLADWQWRSGMRTVAEIDESARVYRVAMAIPFDAFGCRPQAGDVWQANLFRIARLEGERQFLTLSPTFTATPNFHVAASFVALRFVR